MIDSTAIAECVEALPSVAGLSGGAFGEVATYLPGRRVVGVRATPDGVEVRIVARWGPPLPEVAEEVRRAVGPLAGGAPVLVAIDDIELPTPATPELTACATGTG